MNKCSITIPTHTEKGREEMIETCRESHERWIAGSHGTMRFLIRKWFYAKRAHPFLFDQFGAWLGDAGRGKHLVSNKEIAAS